MSQNRFAARFLLVLFLCIGAAWRAWAGTKLLGSTEDIPRNLVANSGGAASGGGYFLDSAVGEVAIATAASGGYIFDSGLENIFAQPGSLTAISTAALSTSTGTLTWTWAAPGFNGALSGTTQAGYYRIEYSSDASQVSFFSPTSSASFADVNVVQFATSAVTVGQFQNYVLTGLLPNTTYYGAIYLGDETRFFAENSPAAAYSTLSNLPVSPVLAGVGIDSVTFSWTLPAGGAEGYALAGSTVNYGVPPLTSSTTANGGTLTLAVNGLNPGTTYFFNLASLNWQGVGNYETLIETVTLPFTLNPVDLLSLSSAPVSRTITLTWTWYKPVPGNENGAVVLVSSMPISAALTNGVAYSPGQRLADGSVVASTQTGIVSGAVVSTPSYVQAGLSLDSTEYFTLFNSNTLNQYSAAVSTFSVLDLPPLAPAGLAAIINPSVSSMTITWSQVVSKTDGTIFSDTATPTGWQLSGFDVYRSTGLIRPTWVLVDTLSATSTSDQEALAPAGMVYYYKIVSKDSYQSQTDPAMAVDTEGNLYALDEDNITRLEIPSSMAGLMQSGGKPLLIRAVDQPQDVAAAPYVFSSVAFEPYEAPLNQELLGLSLPANALFNVSLGYQVQNGQILAANRVKTAPLSVSNSVGLFWYNGQQAIKSGGVNDPINNQVQGQWAMLGDFRLQTYAAPQQASFDPGSDMSTKVITPTETNCAGQHGCDDHVEFFFGNPEYLGYSGVIYDVRGIKVADMAQTGCANGGGPGTPDVCLVWSGRGVNGAVVARGVYIYDIKVGEQVWTGTLVVIR